VTCSRLTHMQVPQSMPSPVSIVLASVLAANLLWWAASVVAQPTEDLTSHKRGAAAASRRSPFAPLE